MALLEAFEFASNIFSAVAMVQALKNQHIYSDNVSTFLYTQSLVETPRN